VGDLFGGTAFALRVGILQSVADEDVAGALVGLGQLLETGTEPRRLTEDLLAAIRDTFLLVSAKGRVRVDAPEDDRDRLVTLGEQMGQAMLVRTLETLGQAVVDMRGTDAADPRLVLEIALVRLARRDAGPPLQALGERVDRLERAISAGATVSAPAAGAAAAPPGPAPAVTREETARRSAPSLAALRRERAANAAAPVDAQLTPVAQPEAEPEPDPTPAAESAPTTPVDIDDVIVAWAQILPDLPPATRAAVREAQPLSVAGDVITFGVPKERYDVAIPRFKKEADNIRGALSEKLGQRMKFKAVAHDGFDVPAEPSAGSAPPEEPPYDDEEVLDISELVDAAPDAAAIDSLSLITKNFDATVVEEVPRD